MKVNRRSFFAAAAAAPVAAKEAVSVIAKEHSGALLGGFAEAPMGYGGGIAIPSAQPGDWMQNELRELLSRRKRISGETPRPELNLAAAMRIDGLRSVSPSVRAQLIAEDRARRAKENELAWMDRQIAEFKEKLGPLGALFE